MIQRPRKNAEKVNLKHDAKSIFIVTVIVFGWGVGRQRERNQKRSTQKHFSASSAQPSELRFTEEAFSRFLKKPNHVLE